MRFSFCCDDMHDAIVDDVLELDIGCESISVIQGGEPIRFCPWCGAPVVFDRGVVH